jgi:hypothetical protein
MKTIDKATKGKIVAAVVNQIRKYRDEKHTTKKGLVLRGLPSRNLGIYKWLQDNYSCTADESYKAVRDMADETKAFVVGFSKFGAIFYLPEDAPAATSAAAPDFNKFL